MSIYSIQGFYSPDVIPSQGTRKIDYTFCVSRFWGLRKRETANTMPISKKRNAWQWWRWVIYPRTCTCRSDLEMTILNTPPKKNRHAHISTGNGFSKIKADYTENPSNIIHKMHLHPPDPPKLSSQNRLRSDPTLRGLTFWFPNSMTESITVNIRCIYIYTYIN